MEINSHVIIYQTEDGNTKIEVKMQDDTVWLSQALMAELFHTTKQNISLHILNIFKENELDENAVVKEFLTTANDGKNYPVKYYNLDVVISVGYRVKSLRGTQFRIWATQRLKEYLIKGFTMNDDLLKNAGGGKYFDELLARIRDIRSSEKVFWRKILEIYALSVDYDPRSNYSKNFFQTVQNKMHWAVHNQTAAELIFNRVDSNKYNMGLTSFSGDKIRKSDIGTAKNYLTDKEIESLNYIVSIYLDFAESSAKRFKVMYMKDWIKKLDDFLRLDERNILEHAGKISHEKAFEKANIEYEKYCEKQKNNLSAVEEHYLNQIECINKEINSNKNDKIK